MPQIQNWYRYKENPREIGSFSHAILYQKWRLNLSYDVCVELHEYNTRLAMQIISKKYQAVRALLLLFSDSIMSLWQNLR